MKRLVFDPSQCSLCGACEMACSLAKGGRLDGASSRIRLETAGDEHVLRAAVCQHCEETACVNACMRGIIEKDGETGLVKRRTEDCFRCAACAVNCPVGACIQDAAENAFVSCDLCGGDPLCAAVCPSGALAYEDDGHISMQKRSRYAQQSFAGKLRADSAAEVLPQPSEQQWEAIARLLSEELGQNVAASALNRCSEARRRAAREEGR